MKLKLSAHHYYASEKIFSHEQLTSDFQAFPPSPLHAGQHAQSVRIVSAAGIGNALHYLNVSRKLIVFSGIGETLRLRFKADADHEASILQAILHANAMTASWWPIPKILFLGFARVVLIVGNAVAWHSRYGSNKAGLAFFHPIDKESGIITVLSRVKQDDPRLAAIRSHEHVHFLQHCGAERHRTHLRTLDGILQEGMADVPGFLELLQKNEIEARLHEIVLSYYRAAGALPLTVEGFWEMLLENEEFGAWLRDAAGCEKSLQGKIPHYLPRSAFFSDQFAAALTGFASPQVLHRFVSEVLTVMYGNLINYYGDSAASADFMELIVRPNLYDRLYGI